jgi:hypothetical protein
MLYSPLAGPEIQQVGVLHRLAARRHPIAIESTDQHNATLAKQQRFHRRYRQPSFLCHPECGALDSRNIESVVAAREFGERLLRADVGKSDQF